MTVAKILVLRKLEEKRPEGYMPMLLPSEKKLTLNFYVLKTYLFLYIFTVSPLNSLCWWLPTPLQTR